jgi:dipeptidyl aminopeptidase/acylaminoacyl peptidase
VAALRLAPDGTWLAAAMQTLSADQKKYLTSIWRIGDPLTSPAMYEANSPHRHIGQIRTPMLVIHGNKDYRVPVGEALRLWWDLSRHGAEAKFLYFPDENHWILTPGNARIWYETIFAFLAEHVLGQPWERPPLL